MSVTHYIYIHACIYVCQNQHRSFQYLPIFQRDQHQPWMWLYLFLQPLKSLMCTYVRTYMFFFILLVALMCTVVWCCSGTKQKNAIDRRSKNKRRTWSMCHVWYRPLLFCLSHDSIFMLAGPFCFFNLPFAHGAGVNLFFFFSQFLFNHYAGLSQEILIVQ